MTNKEEQAIEAAKKVYMKIEGKVHRKGMEAAIIAYKEAMGDGWNYNMDAAPKQGEILIYGGKLYSRVEPQAPQEYIDENDGIRLVFKMGKYFYENPERSEIVYILNPIAWKYMQPPINKDKEI